MKMINNDQQIYIYIKQYLYYIYGLFTDARRRKITGFDVCFPVAHISHASIQNLKKTVSLNTYKVFERYKAFERSTREVNTTDCELNIQLDFFRDHKHHPTVYMVMVRDFLLPPHTEWY